MKTIIIGAGFAGLSAAHALRGKCEVIEAGSRPGGLCRTEVEGGFTFDYTGHLMHLREGAAKDFILNNTPVRMNILERRAFIYSHGTYTGYPYQINNYGLPVKTVEENLRGFFRARLSGRVSEKSFLSWINTSLGSGIAKNFMAPYNSKLWKHPLEKLTLEWLGRFVPSPSMEEVLEGILPKGRKGAGYNANFYYPEKGGIESVIKGIYEGVKDCVSLNEKGVRIDTERRVVITGKGKRPYERLISTMPLKSLLEMTGKGTHRAYSKKLKAVNVYCLNIGFKLKKQIDMSWVYVPEKKHPFYRIGFPHNFSGLNAPEGFGSVFCEVSFHGNKPPAGTDGAIIEGLIAMGIIESRADIEVLLPMTLKGAYVIYDRERREILDKVVPELESKGIFLAGRYGRWEYSSMEDAVVEGFEAARRASYKIKD